MISYIRGELALLEEDKVIIDVGGVGYAVFMPGRAMGRLPAPGNEVQIHTYLHVKEDAMQLFGFFSRDELAVFKQIISVSGIGPKGGLGILSVLSPDELRFAITANDAKAIAAAPGIGKKTAEKLILELRDKLSADQVWSRAEEQGGTQEMPVQEVQTDAVQALTALGYGNAEALRAVRQVSRSEDMTVEEVLKQALKYLM